jgi:N-acetyl-gamma-glutamylphosphate reductase
MIQGEIYKRLREITKDSFEAISMHEVEVTFESLFNEAKNEYVSIVEEASRKIAEAKATYGDIDYDWVKEVYADRDAKQKEWFVKWFVGCASLSENQSTGEKQ